jgi:hypothetical protein
MRARVARIGLGVALIGALAAGGTAWATAGQEGDESVTGPAAERERVDDYEEARIRTRDFASLDDVTEFKYCRGVGLVREEPPGSRLDLVQYR